MIEVYDLNILLDKYGIDSSKILKKNSNIIDKGYYYQIEEVLKYLINELKINPKNVEKCPSVLYRNVYAIKYNYEFLSKTDLNKCNINTCLHILSTNPKEMLKTYEYVLNNYGNETLRKTTSILQVNIDRIKDIEDKYLNIIGEKNVISASISRRTTEEISKIVKVCKENEIQITGNVFRQSAEEIERIIKVCKENEIEIIGNVFLKSAEEIEKIVKVCKENEILITGSVFLKLAEEIEKIVKVCKDNKIEITGSVFLKSAEEIEKIVKVCKDNKIQIIGNVFNRKNDEIERVVKLCKKNKIEITGSIFRQPAEEIEKIVKVCKKNKIEITGNVFLKSAEEIERIIKICKKNKIEIIGSVFYQSAEEIEKIVKVCGDNKIQITGSVFLKSAKEIEETIKFLKENYGIKYLKPLIINKNVKHLQKVFPYLEQLGILQYVINSSSILRLNLEEIQERKEYIESIGEELIIKDRFKFNSIFGMTRKNYQKKKEENKKVVDLVKNK